MELHNARLAEALQSHFHVLPIVNPHGKRRLLPFAIKALFQLARRLRNGDSVLFGDAASAGIAPVLRSIHSGVRWYCAAHGTDVVWPPRWYQNWLTRHVLPGLTAVIAVSHATAKALESRGVSPDRIAIIGNGTDGIAIHDRTLAIDTVAGRFNLQLRQHNVLLSLGRLVPRKGLAWFVRDVMPNLPEDTVLLIGGEGPEQDSIAAEALRLHLRSRVHILGAISDEDRALLYNASDAFVLPNQPTHGDIEGFGITLLEAASTGMQVVATDTDGLRDASRNGELARLVPVGRADAFAATLRTLERTDEGHCARSTRIRDTVRTQCTWAMVAERYAAVLSRGDI